MTERQCSRCRESWPDDEEFFYRAPPTSHRTRVCRACLAEQKRAWDKAHPNRWRERRRRMAA